MYGITETTVHVTYRLWIRSGHKSWAGSVIGRAMPDLQIYVLDADEQPVPVGAAGEMYVGGAGVARGYLNRAGTDGGAFCAETRLTRRSGARMYRTGDLARWLEGRRASSIWGGSMIR